MSESNPGSREPGQGHEGLVGESQEAATTQGNFYCHECAREIDALTSESTCPHCQGSFVEMIDQEDDPRDFDPDDEPIVFDGMGNASLPDLMDGNGGDVPLNNSGEQFGYMIGQLLERVLQPPASSSTTENGGTASTDDAQAQFSQADNASRSGSEPAATQSPAFRFERMDSLPGQTGFRIIGGGMVGDTPRPAGTPARDTNQSSGAQTDDSPPVVNLSTFLRQAFGNSYNTDLGQGERNGESAANQGRPQGMQSFAQVMQTLAQAFGMTGNPGDYLTQQGMDDFITNLMEHQESHAPAAASKETIQNLPHHRLSADDCSSSRYTDCAICKEDFVQDDGTINLPCKHTFHDDCITQWLQKSATCPVCRFILNAPASEQPAGANVPADVRDAQDEASSSSALQHPMEDLD